MKRIAFYLSLVLVVLVLASCKKGQKNLFTPTSSGRPYEVLVVVNKAVWDRPAGRECQLQLAAYGKSGSCRSGT